MTIKQLKNMADKLSSIINKPVEIELNNPGGYDIVVWIGEQHKVKSFCNCFCNNDYFDADGEQYTAAEQAYNYILNIVSLMEHLNRNETEESAK